MHRHHVNRLPLYLANLKAKCSMPRSSHSCTKGRAILSWVRSKMASPLAKFQSLSMVVKSCKSIALSMTLLKRSKQSLQSRKISKRKLWLRQPLKRMPRLPSLRSKPHRVGRRIRRRARLQQLRNRKHHPRLQTRPKLIMWHLMEMLVIQ